MGLITLAHDGKEIAAVLAHELAHVTERHGMQRVLRGLGASVLFGMVLGSVDLGALGGYAESLTHLAYDRDQEREADVVGRDLLRRASIPPDGLATFFARMQAEHGDTNALTTLISSHPALRERALAAAAPVALPDPATVLPRPEGLTCSTKQ
jgi:beta-barrel assembly-enhancing protease